MKGECERMVKDAEQFQAGDKGFKRRLKAMQAFQKYVYNTRDDTRKKLQTRSFCLADDKFFFKGGGYRVAKSKPKG